MKRVIHGYCICLAPDVGLHPVTRRRYPEDRYHCKITIETRPIKAGGRKGNR